MRENYCANLDGRTRHELRYILDPKEVYGENLPGETFHVLKEKGERLYREYRTRSVVLEARMRAREAPQMKGARHRVGPQLPPDVFWLYVYLPVAK